MSRQDWFRKVTWSDADREDFFQHLKRSRTGNRAQYLRIQAYHLQTTGKDQNIRVALELLELLAKEYPGDMQLNLGYLAMAECRDALRDVPGAIEAFHYSFEAMRRRPNIKVGTQFAFGRFVIKHNLRDYYDAAMHMLMEFTEKDEFVFPSQSYYFYAIAAIIASRCDQREIAVDCAGRALSAAQRTHSGISRHLTFGIVKEQPSYLQLELEQILK